MCGLMATGIKQDLGVFGVKGTGLARHMGAVTQQRLAMMVTVTTTGATAMLGADQT